ncbi:MAG: hypothetical protein H6622_13490 [Halobacteriovoraceae bacterium]|nr:hypothetical protein [Halobacteriovoraceae bacterium]
MQVTKPHIFSSDRPISQCSEDLLDRAKFSAELAKSISNWEEKDSLVLAIYGAWGDGKSSVKNMIKERLSEKENNRSVSILEFNPWQWGNSEKITKAFFEELSSSLKESDDRQERKIGQKLELYSKYLALSDDLITKIKDWLQKLLLSLGSGGLLSGYFFEEQAKKIIIVCSIVVLVLSQLIDVISFGVNWLLKLINLKKTNGSTLDSRKNEIKIELSKLDRTVVIVLDDIDRLSKEETRILFKLIKANADFPNIVYLTFFQRDIVENSLNEDSIYAGKDYLKKIIQVGFNLPHLSRSKVHSILFKKLDELLSMSQLDKNFEKGRWSSIFNGGLGQYFNNLRDVNRFISTFTFHFGILKTDKTYEINFIDLVGLEVLRQFEPNIYTAIHSNKDAFTKDSSSGYEHERTRYKEIINNVIDKNEIGDKEIIQTIFSELFPNVKWAYSNYSRNIHEEDFQTLRVCHPDIFDRYFLLNLPEGDLSKSEFDYVLSITNDEEALYKYLIDLNSRGLLETFIDKFENYKQVVDKEHAVDFVSCMFRIGDILSDEHEGFFHTSPVVHVQRIIHWYFKKQDFGDNKKDLYKEALKKTKGIFLPLDAIYSEIITRKEDQYPDNYVFSESDFDELKEIAAQIIERVLKDEQQLVTNRHFPRILHCWKLLVSEQDMKDWFNKYIATDENLLFFLSTLVSKSFSSSGYETKIEHHIHNNWLSVFFDDLEEVYSRIPNLEALAQTDDKKITVKALKESEDKLRHPEKYKNRW